uniref:CRAL-TRIO domain-containing protein n=1 Tax=Strigamia maritima TaxID=126957 RepID=T1IME0_STRMM
MLFLIIKPFISDENRKRIHFHGYDMTSLHRHICADILEFGGAKPPMDNSEFVHEMLAKYEDFYEANTKYGYSVITDRIISNRDQLFKMFLLRRYSNELIFKSDSNADLMSEEEQELREKPECRDRDIQALRDMILARKFNTDRAFQLVKNYYKIRLRNPQLYKNYRPSALTSIFAHNLQTVLPDRDHFGRKVLIFNMGKWNPKHNSMDDVHRANEMCLEIAIEEEETQINGVVCIANMKDFGIHQARHYTPTYLKHFASLMQDVFPARFKAIHVVNENTIVHMLIVIFKPLLSIKIRKRSSGL